MSQPLAPRPTPAALAARPRRPQPIPARTEPERPPAAAGWDRAAYEASIRSSPQAPYGLHPVARLVGFLLAQYATDTGHLPANRVPAARQLARAAGIDDAKARASLNSLEHGDWIVRHRSVDADGHAQPAAITLTLPTH
ncbi:hypothetical protein [Streptomyces albipurpureus]|uniref:Uncharacterized protein n=1 Tax=Streptomyces albipurpureus TaxID=2897419 RepID=A0ABT0UP97_9ACTN|nr:hypothetical protein [Streptomyces sp. CWNU-1]MCM2390166.1 hypothetical protein [Streptomyces sp. CWNU-1]